jgi:hypothetical protein
VDTRERHQATYRANNGRLDVVFRAFNGKSFRESNKSHLGSGIVGLAKVSW